MDHDIAGMGSDQKLELQIIFLSPRLKLFWWRAGTGFILSEQLRNLNAPDAWGRKDHFRIFILRRNPVPGRTPFQEEMQGGLFNAVL